MLKECKTLTPISDQEIISPYNIHTLASRRVLRIKRLRRIVNEILGIKGFKASKRLGQFCIIISSKTQVA